MLFQLAMNRKILAASMMPPTQGRPPASPMLARAKILTSRVTRRLSDTESTEDQKREPHNNSTEDSNSNADSSSEHNKKNIIDRIRSVVSSPSQSNGSSSSKSTFQPNMPPPSNKIGRFFGIKPGGLFGTKLLPSPSPTNFSTNLMDTVPSGSTSSLNSLASETANEKRTKVAQKSVEQNTQSIQSSKKGGLKRTGSLKDTARNMMRQGNNETAGDNNTNGNNIATKGNLCMATFV